MVVFVSEEFVGDGNVVIGVSSNWSTAVKRLMETTQFTEYKECKKLSDTLWEITLPDGWKQGYITKCEMDKRVTQ